MAIWIVQCLCRDEGLKMRYIKSWARHIACVMAAMALVACGGGGGEGLVFVPQFNVAERDLYEPGRADSGVVAQRGYGGISLQLEAPSGTPLPWGGDTSSLGEDKFYFDLLRNGYISLTMPPQMQALIEAVELYDGAGNRVWRLDASNPAITEAWLLRSYYTSPVARFQVRIVAAPDAVDTPHVLVWFGDGLVPTSNRNDLGKLQSGAVVNCADCNLSGAQLGAYKLESSALNGANLRNTWLVRVSDASLLSLGEFNLFKIFWDGAQVAGARMSRAYLEGADFTGAIVTGAGNSPAEFEAAHLYNAIMNGLNLDRVNMNAAFLSRAQIKNASMIEAQLNSAQMSGTNFSHSNLYKAQFKNAMVTGTNFSFANLEGANFQGALMDNVVLTGAILSGATWQDGRICSTPSVGACL